MKQNKSSFKRSGVFNCHHILPRARGGAKQAKNMLLLDARRHFAFHLLFGNRTLLEAAAVLKRTHDIKEKQKKGEINRK